MGSDPIALPLLDWLAGEGGALASIAAVVTQPTGQPAAARRPGLGQSNNGRLRNGVPVRQPERRSATKRDWLAAQQADVALVLAYGHILPGRLHRHAAPGHAQSARVDSAPVPRAPRPFRRRLRKATGRHPSFRTMRISVIPVPVRLAQSPSEWARRRGTGAESTRAD